MYTSQRPNKLLTVEETDRAKHPVTRSASSPVLALLGMALSARPAAATRTERSAKRRGATRRMENLRRRSGEHALFAARSDQQGQLLEAEDRLAAQDHQRFGPRPDTLYSATPLFVDNVLYTTAGTARTVVALNPETGEVLWKHVEDEGPRGQNAPRAAAPAAVSRTGRAPTDPISASST